MFFVIVEMGLMVLWFGLLLLLCGNRVFLLHNVLLYSVGVDVKGGLGVKEKPDYPNSIVHRCTFPFPTENEHPSCLRLFVFLLLRPYCVRPYCSSVRSPLAVIPGVVAIFPRGKFATNLGNSPRSSALRLKQLFLTILA